MRRVLAIVMVLTLSLMAIPASASPERGNSGDRGNSEDRGRPTVRVVKPEIKEPSRVTINRDRQGRLSLSIVGLEATGKSECPRGRCQAVNGHSAEVRFDDMQLDLRAVSRGDGGHVYEAQGRVSGTVIWTNNEDEVLRSRWHGTLSSVLHDQLDVVRTGYEHTEGSTKLELSLLETTILGIAIDHVGAGLTIEDFDFSVIIDHIDAG